MPLSSRLTLAVVALALALPATASAETEPDWFTTVYCAQPEYAATVALCEAVRIIEKRTGQRRAAWPLVVCSRKRGQEYHRCTGFARTRDFGIEARFHVHRDYPFDMSYRWWDVYELSEEKRNG